MNVYINKSYESPKLLILVAANSEKEAWDYLMHGEDKEYYYSLYDNDSFKLIGDVSANTDVPKIVYETTLVDNNFPLLNEHDFNL